MWSPMPANHSYVWPHFHVTFRAMTCVAESHSVSAPDSWGQAFMTQTLTNGLSHTRPVAVTDPMHLPCLIKCHKWPFLNYLKLLTSPNLFMQYLSPSLRGPWRCSFSTVRQNVPQILTRSWSSAFTECFQLWLFNKSTGNKHLVS